MVVAYKDGCNPCIAHRDIQKLDDVSLHSACKLYNKILHKLSSDLKLNGLLILSSWCCTNRITNVWVAVLLKAILWLLHPDPTSHATIKDQLMDKWTMQPIGITDYLFEAVINGKQSLCTSDHYNMTILMVYVFIRVATYS